MKPEAPPSNNSITIQGCEIRFYATPLPGGRVDFTAKADIDCDGGSNPEHDPCWQPDTTLHFRGHAIDADTVPYMVVPPAIITGVRGVVLGCACLMTHTLTRKSCLGVVADVGPRRKLGELSPEAARRIGVNPHPVRGGEGRRIIHYQLWPDVPAEVDGITYQLQPWGGR